MNWKETNMNVNSVIGQKYMIIVNCTSILHSASSGRFELPWKTKKCKHTFKLVRGKNGKTSSTHREKKDINSAKRMCLKMVQEVCPFCDLVPDKKVI